MGESETNQTATSQPVLRLLVVSTLLLFFELVLIRYLSTEIPAVGFFKNLILIGCFLGFGLGLGLRLSPARALGLFAVAALTSPLAVAAATVFGVNRVGFTGLANEAVLLGPTLMSVILGIATVSGAFLLAVVPLVFLGSLVGRYFDAFDSPLSAYGWNLLGSLAGTLGFTAISWASTPPAAWFAISGVLLAVMVVLEGKNFAGRGRALVMAASLVPAVLVAVGPGDEAVWTPYYKVSMEEMSYDSGLATGYRLNVNNTWFQRSFDVSYLDRPEEVGEDAHAARRLRFVAPFSFAQPESVLVLGSGLGNDAAAALWYGAQTVRAIDIDPVILRLSETFHPNQPYLSEDVEVVVDDARHFLHVDSESYDLILFGVLEARSLFSQFSNLRLDNYVYTREALEAAHARLTDGGVLWLNIWVPKPWVKDKFTELMRTLFGNEFVVLKGIGSEHYSFVGCRGACALEDLPAQVAALGGIETVAAAGDVEAVAGVSVPTDDWPYVFYRNRTLPASYMLMLVGLVAISIAPLRVMNKDLFQVDWGFFFLGAAFLLIETAAVTRMALLAGTTWVVNSAVFASVLVFIYLANWGVERLKPIPPTGVWIGLIVSLLLAYGFPFARLLEWPNFWSIVAGAAILTLPVLFAGVLFSSYFRAVTVPSRALASNLFGAVLGGFAEYFSMLLGNRAMGLLALAAYLAAWATLTRSPIPSNWRSSL